MTANSTVRFGSVCSGIEAASVAWHPLGWEAAWFSEIEPFPCAVLAYHYPAVPNLGDMTTLPQRIIRGEVEAPEVFCGGTPCQAFSVAGMRRSLDDARGNLSLTFVEIADAVDAVRVGRGERPCVVFWENVPGVLSTADNAFGCFLAGLAGEDVPLEPPGGRWSNAGAVLGPSRAVAWRVLDAQYFGLAQRRRRVFVVASARDGFDPAAVLLEWEGVRRDSPPSREAREVAPTIPARSTGGGDLGADFDGGLIPDVVGALTDGAHNGGGSTVRTPTAVGYLPPIANPLTARMSKGINTTCDEGQTLIPTTGGGFDVAHSLRGEGFDASEDGTGRGTPLVPVAFHPTQDPISSTDGTTHAMGCGSKGGTATVAVAFTAKDYGGDAGEIAPTLRAMGHGASHANGGGQVAIAFQPGNLTRGAGSPPSSEVFPTLKSDHGRGASDQQPHVMQLYTLAIRGRGDLPELEYRQDGTANALLTPNGGRAGIGVGAVAQPVAVDTYNHTVSGDCAGSLTTTGGPPLSGPGVLQAMQVRRLTPTECERLQGFPDGYTQIPWRGKPADQCPDGPRYKALGNSWAVPVVRWVGRRIDGALKGEKLPGGEP